MPNTQQVGWWGRMTSAVNSPVHPELIVSLSNDEGRGGEVSGFPPLKKGGEGGFKDSYQELGHCKDMADCLAQKLGSSMWLPLVGAFGALKILDARQRRITVDTAKVQLEQGEAYLRDKGAPATARLIGAAADTFYELDDAYSEALARERQGDVLRFIGYVYQGADVQGAYDRAAAIFGRLIEQVSGIEGYETLVDRLQLKLATVLKKAERFGEAAEIYNRLPSLQIKEGKALVLGGRYADAVKAFKAHKAVQADTEEIKGNSLLLTGTQYMAKADKLAEAAGKSQPELITASKVFIKWQRAREAFYSAALEYRSGDFFELESVALGRALDAARWEVATYNGPGHDNRRLQAKYLREKAVALGRAHLFGDAADAFQEELDLHERGQPTKSLKVAKRLKGKMLADELKALKKDPLSLDILQADTPRKLLAVRNFVSSFGPEMLKDASSVRSARQMIAGLVAPDRDVEETINDIASGDWRRVDGLDNRKFASFISPADWKALVRTARLLNMLNNAGVDSLVSSLEGGRPLTASDISVTKPAVPEMGETPGGLGARETGKALERARGAREARRSNMEAARRAEKR